MKFRSLGAELHADGQIRTNRYDEANSRFSQFLRKAPENAEYRKKIITCIC